MELKERVSFLLGRIEVLGADLLEKDELYKAAKEALYEAQVKLSKTGELTHYCPRCNGKYNYELWGASTCVKCSRLLYED